MSINFPDDFEIPAGYHSEPAPCGTEIWGTPYDIDSGLRRHIDGCETCQEIRSRD